MKTIFWGNYWQSNKEEKEPIEWLVIKEETDKMYVISKYCLDYVPYSDGHKIAWGNSLARKWLNKDFIRMAFSKEEQNKIILSDIKTSRGGWDVPELDNGDAVKDKVFLPSLSEMFLYLDSNVWHDITVEQKRIARPTNFAYEKGCYIYPLKCSVIQDNDLYKEFMGSSFDENALYWNYEAIQGYSFEKGNDFQSDTSNLRWASEWYLRSPGFNVIKVLANGKAQSFGEGNSKGTAIRPAMWIKK